jgi:hypothetical protein
MTTGDDQDVPGAREEDWISLPEACVLSGYSEEYVRRLHRQSKIVTRSGHRRALQIEKHSLLAYLAAHPLAALSKQLRDGTKPKPAQRDDDRPLGIFAPDLHAITVGMARVNGEDEPPRAQFVLTDQIDEMMHLIPRPYVLVSRDVTPNDVRELLQRRRVAQFFSTASAADLVCQKLQISNRLTARAPQVTHGDNIITVKLQRTTFGINLVFVLYQILA